MISAISTRGMKKTSAATCECKKSDAFEIRINKVPLSIHNDRILIAKFEEVITMVGEETVQGLDFDIKTKNRHNHIGNVYAARQAFCRALCDHYGKFSDEYKKQEIKNAMVKLDRYTVVTDTRRKEAKKYGGKGARARYQKSYR
ncbi:small subunit ribosomal protein S16e [Enteropsectra breve]|nr:small subunit ribosomal protein S16e [Enteropsectra breve]